VPTHSTSVVPLNPLAVFNSDTLLSRLWVRASLEMLLLATSLQFLSVPARVPGSGPDGASDLLLHWLLRSF
jgi:hypothetical protein